MIGTSAFLFSRVYYSQSNEEVVGSWWGGEGNVVVAE